MAPRTQVETPPKDVEWDDGTVGDELPPDDVEWGESVTAAPEANSTPAADPRRPGTAANPARAVESETIPMSPEEAAKLNPAWTPPPTPRTSPFAKYTSDPALQMELEEASTGGLTAAVRGVNDILTRGWADEILGRVGSAFPRLTDWKYLQPGSVPPKLTYEQVRDEMRTASEQSKDVDPLSYYGAGLAASLLAPGPKGDILTKGAGGAARLGALEGAVGALGNSTADLGTTEGNVQATLETGLGSGLGAAFGAGGYGLGVGSQFLINKYGPTAGKAISDWLAKAAERRAVKAAVGNDYRTIVSMLDKDTLQSTGRDLLDYGRVKANMSTEAIRKSVNELKDKAGQDIDTALSRVEAGATGDLKKLWPDEMANEIYDKVIEPMEGGTAGQRMVAERLKREAQALAEQGKGPNHQPGDLFDQPITLKQAEVYKRALDEPIYWDKVEPPPVQEGLKKFRGLFNEQIERRGEEIANANPEVTQDWLDFLASKKLYGSMANVATPGLKQQAREQANRLVSLTDYGAGGTGALLAGLLSDGSITTSAAVGAAALGANKWLRERGNQTFADYANRASKSNFIESLIGREPQVLGKYAGQLTNALNKGGRAGLAIEDYMLGSTDEEYARLRRELAERDGATSAQ